MIDFLSCFLLTGWALCWGLYGSTEDGSIRMENIWSCYTGQ